MSTAWWSGVLSSSDRHSPSISHSSSRPSCSLSRGSFTSWGRPAPVDSPDVPETEW
ncbi:hypothetical protein DPMN_017269 [Dreissena polymorpha]|uniref:Uncharacterized protein n=1 Tax=Dreissena polymorpha TaxID=45954 RepID=A0A9D4NEW1_DREPO|nr:hypothetical protein DPMN_017269 [Dreissena polymorpha]